MRDLLFLAHRIPFPPDKGDKIRAWNVFRHLARTHRIHLGCFIDDPADRLHLATLEKHCAELICLPIDPRRQHLKALLRLRPGQPLSTGYFQLTFPRPSTLTLRFRGLPYTVTEPRPDRCS